MFYGLGALLVPLLIAFFCLYSIDIYWGSERLLIYGDAIHQFYPFYSGLSEVLHGNESLFWTWNLAGGLNFYSLWAYYCGGIFPLISIFATTENLPDFMYLLYLLKIGLAGLSFYFFAKQCYKLPSIFYLIFSWCWALCGFVTVYALMIPSWHDALIYLPMVILGIERLLNEKYPILLFISYFLVFVSNYYLGYMVALFSLCYFIIRYSVSNHSKKVLLTYFVTAMTSGIASFIVILPAGLDVFSNLIPDTTENVLFTGLTDPLIVLTKSFPMMFDGSALLADGTGPYLFVGIFALLLFGSYFFAESVVRREKIAFASLIAFLIASMYLTPLNLLWTAGEVPTSFPFRYSFLLSFLILYLAMRGLESWLKKPRRRLFYWNGILAGVLAVVTFINRYSSIYLGSHFYFATFILLGFTVFLILYYRSSHIRYFALCVAILSVIELSMNTYDYFNRQGTSPDLFRYSFINRSDFETNTAANGILANKISAFDSGFYRIAPRSRAILAIGELYHFPSYDVFSSIKNINNSAFWAKNGVQPIYLNDLSAPLSVSMENNLLFADNLFGNKYFFSKAEPNVIGLNVIPNLEVDTYKVYENELVLPLGMLTDDGIYQLQFDSNNVITNTGKIYRYLANSELNYSSSIEPKVIAKENTKISNQLDGNITMQAIAANEPIKVSWSVDIPAGYQAYFLCQPLDKTVFSNIFASFQFFIDNKIALNVLPTNTGYFYSIGHFSTNQKVNISLQVSGLSEIPLTKPLVVLINEANLRQDTAIIQEKGVDLKVEGRRVTGKYQAVDEQVLFTTIPYDRGWQAYIDDKKAAVKAFDKGLLTVELPAGEHEVKLIYTPYGFKVGVVCFVLGIASFTSYLFLLKNRKA